VDSERPSLLRRALAIAVLLIVAVIALRLAIGIVSGLIIAALWIVVAVALIGGVLWARSTLKSGKRERRVEESPRAELRSQQPGEDPVDYEIRKITEQLREQGRR
jgi:hypothetical protein